MEGNLFRYVDEQFRASLLCTLPISVEEHQFIPGSLQIEFSVALLLKNFGVLSMLFGHFHVAEHIGETSEQLCTWLMSASLYQAHNTYAINPFRKDEESQVTEIDGTPCRNFFTILNIGLFMSLCVFL